MKRWPKIIEDRVRGELIPLSELDIKKYDGVTIELGKCVLGTKNETEEINDNMKIDDNIG